MQELREVLKKYGWKFLGTDGNRDELPEEGWDAPQPGLYVCSIGGKGWYINHQWSCNAPPFCAGKSAVSLGAQLQLLDEINSWKTGE
jgi:hypothetical protein